MNNATNAAVSDDYADQQHPPTPETQVICVAFGETFDDVMGDTVKAAREQASLERINQQQSGSDAE